MGPGSGRDISLENLRELCIFQVYPKQWWDYMRIFDDQCVEYDILDKCSEKTIKSLGLDKTKLDKCVNDSFVKNGTNPLNILIDDNKLLEKELSVRVAQGIGNFPSVTINNKQYLGNILSSYIFEAICSTFSSPPGCCNEVSGPASSGIGYGTIVVVILISFAFFFIILCCIYRRYMKNELSKEMNLKVNQMVGQYVAMYESRDKKGDSSVIDTSSSHA